MNNLKELVYSLRNFYVIRNKNYEVAKEICEVLIENGAKSLEITFTVPYAEKLVKEIAEKHQDVVVGSGTVMYIEQAVKAFENGSKFIVGPIFSQEVSDYCHKKGIIYIPGASTLQDVYNIVKDNWDFVKIFPCDLDGPNFVKIIKTFFPSCKFMASGGINIENMNLYLKSGYDSVAIGSFLTGTSNSTEIKKDFIKKTLKLISKI